MKLKTWKSLDEQVKNPEYYVQFHSPSLEFESYKPFLIIFYYLLLLF